MLAEALPVVSHHRHQSALEEPARFELCQHTPDHRVGVSDLSGVERVRILTPVGLGRLVGRVGVVEMNPGEERLLGRLKAQPRAEGGGDGASVPLGLDVLEQPDVGAHLVVIDVESL